MELGIASFIRYLRSANAGIDILGSDSLAKYICNPLINITTMLLIILSGIGFSVWYDVLGNIKKSERKKFLENGGLQDSGCIQSLQS